MWNTFLGKHIKPLSAEVVLALIPSRICSYQFRNCLDNLTLRNTMAVTFKLAAIKNRCSWFTQLYICAIYSLLVFVIYCAFTRQYYSLFVQYFIRCLIIFHLLLSFVLIVVQKKKNNSEPELCSGISILQYNKYLRLFQHHHLESINIIQQTPPTLS
jgi:hypothetical protein